MKKNIRVKILSILFALTMLLVPLLGACTNGTGTVAVTRVSVTPNPVTISVDGTRQLTATVSPADATNPEVTWTSSNPALVAVSNTGLVTGVAAGTATITATADGVSGTATVTVSAPIVTCPDCGKPVDECECEPTILNGFALSHAPGLFDEEFDLAISFIENENARIYYTLDGSVPVPGTAREIDGTVVSGGIDSGDTIEVTDRTTEVENTLLSRYTNVWQRKSGQGLEAGTTIPMGNAFRFRAFVDGEPVSNTITATYIIMEDAATRFADTPVISVTAAYAPCEHPENHACTPDCSHFVGVYRNAGRWTGEYNNANRNTNRPPNAIGRHIFNYEFFTTDDDGTYISRFNLEGRTNLGGSWTRDNAQRSLNVHMRAGNSINGGALNGTVHYPIWEGGAGEGIHRFRLWNGGNNFVGHRNWFMGSDHFRDPFVQSTAEMLNTPTSRSRLAIKFINGEFWGFTQLRQQTDNEAFAADRLGLEEDNIVVVDRGLQYNNGPYLDDMEAGDEEIAQQLYDELEAWVISNIPLSGRLSDTVVEQLFDTWLCKENFIDFYLVNTFWNATDWPHNNTRFWRAITTTNDDNPFGDGRWRFTLHDMDQAANGVIGGAGYWGQNSHSGSRWSDVINPRIHGIITSGSRGPELNRVGRVFTNAGFAAEFRARAEFVIANYWQPAQLLEQYEYFYNQFTPLLTDMYNRWSLNPAESRDSFNRTTSNVRYFLNNRQAYFTTQIGRADFGVTI